MNLALILTSTGRFLFILPACRQAGIKTKEVFMDLPNMFEQHGIDTMLKRINQLTENTTNRWGKMDVAQMLAHCCAPYETIYTDKHPRPNALMKLLIKWYAKPVVIGPKPYPRNGRTAPSFKVTEARNFAEEKERLVNYIRQTQELGAAHFDGKESLSMGALSVEQWNTLFAKHLDHHLRQFGV